MKERGQLGYYDLAGVQDGKVFKQRRCETWE
jgi:hypothetical protein